METEVEVENFEETMLKLQKHFTTHPSKRKHATVEQLLGKTVNRDLAAAGPLPQDAQAAINIYEGTMNSDNGSRESNMTTAVQVYEKNKSQTDFEKQMNAYRDKDLKNAEANITKMYDNLIQSGKQNPSSQAAILNATVLISEFSNQIWTAFTTFVSDLVAKISQWIQEAFNKVKNWVSDAANKVGNFFKSLF